MPFADHTNQVFGARGASNWHALFVRYQHEKSVAAALASKDYEVYLPLRNSTRHWQDRTKQLWLPLFPGYVFIREGMGRRVQILSTPGLIHIVCFGGGPAIISQNQLDAVKQILQSDASAEPHPYLSCGDRVKVKQGALAGLEGILIRKKNRAQLVISMEMLGQSASVEIEAANVTRIGARLSAPANQFTCAVA